MNEIHPDWQETEGDSVPVRIKTAVNVAESQTPKSVTISRKPAAIVGMFLVLGFGALFFYGLDGLMTGQVSNQGNTKTVTITAQAFSPSTIEVEHGQTIVWINQDVATHAVLSSTLCSNTGFCLQTAPLAKGGQGTFTITPDIPSGTYSYSSSTDPLMKGTIDIVTTATDDFENLPSPSETNENGIPVNPNAKQGDIETAGTIFDPTVNPFAFDPNEIPSNPFTAKNDNQNSLDSEGSPISALFEPAPTQAQTKLMNSKPAHQPTTGPGMWCVILGSMFLLGWALRGKLQAIAISKD